MWSSARSWLRKPGNKTRANSCALCRLPLRTTRETSVGPQAQSAHSANSGASPDRMACTIPGGL